MVGLGATGLLCLFAASCADKLDRIYAEVGTFDLDDDDAWAEHCPIPAIRSVGDVRTALALIVPTKLYIHTRKGRGFPAGWARKLYRGSGKAANLRISTGRKSKPERVVRALFGPPGRRIVADH